MTSIRIAPTAQRPASSARRRWLLLPVICGVARAPGDLVATRLLQGLAAAAVVPQVLAIITTAPKGR